MITIFKLFESKNDYSIFYDIIFIEDEKTRLEKVNDYILSDKNINAHNSSGVSILMLSIHKGLQKEIKLIIDAGTDVNYENQYKETALSWFVEKYQWYIVESAEYIKVFDYLLNAGVKIDVTLDDYLINYLKINYSEKYKEYMKKKTIKKFKI